MTSPAATPADPAAPEKTIEMPPTLAIIAVVLLAAAILAQLLTPGAYERREITIKKSGIQWTAHTVAEGETLDAIIEQYGGKASIVGEISDSDPAAGKPTPVTTLSAGQIIHIPRHPTDTRKVVVPGTYKPSERPKQTAWERTAAFCSGLCQAPFKGFVAKAEIIAFILLIGAAFGVVLATGAIDAALHATVEKLGNAGLGWIAIPVCMFTFSLCGATFGMAEEVIPFVMITIPLAFKLGYDSYVGISVSFVAAGLGFATGFFNPFTVQIAQGIAELEPLSGWQFRVGLWIAVTLVGIAYVMPYAAKVRRNPELSPAFESDKLLRARFATPAGQVPRLTLPNIGVLLVLLAVMVATSWGVIVYHWYLGELTGFFLAGGILSGVVAGLPIGKAVNAFLKGAADLVPAAIVVAFSAGIVQVLNDAQVMDTILHSIASPLEGTHTIIGAWLMFLFQSLMNLLVNSGSGQAAMTMPLMAPLSDLMGVSRQTAVLAYQFGNGFADMILPTSAVTMSVLGIARIPWERWIVWAAPLQLLLAIFGCIALAIAVLMGYS